MTILTLSGVEELTERLAPVLAPAIKDMIDGEVERRVGELELARRTDCQTRDDEIMAACREVAGASDALLAARYTQRESLALRRLERAAAALKLVMRGRPR